MPRVPGGGSTCWTVIRGAAAGSGAERTQVVTTYTPAIRAYLLARWRGTPHAQSVDDAAQEVFLACFREGGALERADPSMAGGFRAYLYGIVRNVAREFEKRRARRPVQRLDSALAEDGLPADDASLSRVFDRSWAVTIMTEAAEAQRRAAESKGPDAVRRVELLRLRFREDLPIREIAVRWNEDAALLHREYAAARREFQEALLDVILFHRPGSRERARDEARELLAMLGD
jgi:RNA polymerase sigma-70 factor (ECF subfamily)